MELGYKILYKSQKLDVQGVIANGYYDKGGSQGEA